MTPKERAAKALQTKALKKQEAEKPSWAVFPDGSKKKVWGFYTNGYLEEASHVCYEDGNYRVWKHVERIDTINKLYFIKEV